MNDACAALFGGKMNWAILTVPELKEALRERDLPVSGKKADLIARLKKSDAPVASTHDAPATSSSDAKTIAPSSESTDSDGPLGGLGEEGRLRRSYA